MSFAAKYGVNKRMAKGGHACSGADCPVCYADGGPVLDPDKVKRFGKSFSGTRNSDDIVGRIMMSRGGRVSNEIEPVADSLPNEFDDLVLRDDLEFSYDGDNSGDKVGNKQEDEDRRDIVSRIMRSRAKKDRNPRPA